MEMILPSCTIELTDEQEKQLKPLIDAVSEHGFVPQTRAWAILSQSLTDDGSRLKFGCVIVREVARAGIAAIAQADRRERGEIL